MIIETVELRAADTQALHQFYGERLGLPTTRNGATGELVITIGKSRLIFREEPRFAERYHFAFNIPGEGITGCRAFLEGRGVTLLADAGGQTVFDFDFWDAHALYFFDPAGNIAEGIARHELPPAAPNDPFAAGDFLNISEVGLVCGDVPTVAGQIKATCGVGDYRDTSPTFHPLGDAHGLLILVPSGRAWFPDTGIPARACPLRLTVRNTAGQRFALSYGDNQHTVAALAPAGGDGLPEQAWSR